MIRPAFFSILLLVAVATVPANVELENLTSSGLFWSGTSEEVRLLDPVDDDFSAGADGGFSSFEGMLQWAIGHSDPTTLKERAQDVQRMSSSDLTKRQTEIKELMEKLKTPSDAQLMQIAIDDLNNSSISGEDRYRALQELLILVEPIDSANDFDKLGGLISILRELHNADSEIRTISAWIIGKACQNNPLVQKQALEHGVLLKLMKMVKSSTIEEAIKAVYAISALIRNNVYGQTLFFAEHGDRLLQDLISDSIDWRLCRKVVSLISDLAESNFENLERTELPFLDNKHFLKSVVDLLASTNLDLREKTLLAIKNILQLSATDALVFRDFCYLDIVLERFRNQLRSAMLEEDQKDYAADLEVLCTEVESLYHAKLSSSAAAS